MKKLLTIIALAFALAAPALAQNTTQKINKKNLVIKEWNTEPRSGKKVLDHVTTFDADGKKIEEIEYGSEGQKWRKRFEYGADGKCVKEMVYNDRNKLETVQRVRPQEDPVQLQREGKAPHDQSLRIHRRRCLIPRSYRSPDPWTGSRPSPSRRWTPSS